jgi:hypothetical protein
MSFVTDLRAELVEAAEREQARRRPRLHFELRPMLLTAAAAAALVAVVVIAAGSLRTAPDDDSPVVAEPTPEGRPLFGGTMTPDVRYRTSVFVPALSFVVADDRWMALDTTLEDELRLARVKRGGPPGPNPPRIQQLLFQRIPEVADPSIRGLQASRTPAPADLYEWFRDHPDLRVGPARPVTVAGVPGERFDVRVRFDRPAHLDPWCQRFSEFPCTFLAPGLNPGDGAHLRMTILRTEPQPLVITEGGMSAADLAAVEKAARPLLDSLQIGVR